MNKLTVFLAALGLSVGVMAKPVKSFDQAIDLVMKSVEKNKLTSLKKECLMFVESEQTDKAYIVDVRENHNAECGGDPHTALRLFTYSVNKANGIVKTDDISQAPVMFKHYVLQNNNIDKCLFSAIYRSDDNGEATLDKWWLDTENGGRMKYAYYLKLKLRLAQKTMSSDVAEMFHNGKLSSELQEQYERAVEKYGKRTTQKNCKVVQKYAQNLIENYDETNERWRKAFPNP